MENATEYVDKAGTYFENLIDLLVNWAPKAVLAIGLLVVGIIIINRLVRIFRRLLKKREIDSTLIPFLTGLVNITLKAVLIISVIDIVGIKTTSFVAVLGAAGLAVGLALQGSLGNFAGGVLIIIFKPYKVGDYIETQGQAGTVESIQIFNTVLTNFESVRIIIPNGAMSSGNITNYSARKNRRLDLVFGISYGDDLENAKNILKEMAASDERILKDPEPFIAVQELAESSVNLLVRIWCKNEDYWNINFDWKTNVKLRFDKEGITFPFPQREVTTYVGQS
ncbi:MAG TPA: mechanosensitive ion channel [Bacteroides sp.]|nr:mechanosensitive ion channel [Bacteroides sp.]